MFEINKKLVRDFMAKEEQNEHHYEGNGRVSGAVGKATIYSAIAGVTVGLGTLVATKDVDRAWLAGKAAAALGLVSGSIHGWSKADAGIKDQEELVAGNAKLTEEVTKLQRYVVNAITKQGLVEAPLEKGAQVG
jgi:hypothetical protein